MGIERTKAASRVMACFAALCLGGCFAGEPASMGVKKVGGATAVSGAVLVATSVALAVKFTLTSNWGCPLAFCPDPHARAESLVFWSGAAGLGVGTLLVLAGLGMAHAEAEEAQRVIARAEIDQVVPANVAMAERLMASAHVIAASGNCRTVAIIAKRIEALDPTYYDHVFKSDVVIKQCEGPPVQEGR